MKITFFTYLLLFTNFFLAFGQNENVPNTYSLTEKSYENLLEEFTEFEYKNPKIARTYADAYVLKAKNEKDSIQIATGYRYISFLYMNKEDTDNILKYSDSITFISKNSNHNSFPALGYFQIGMCFFDIGQYKKALDNFLIAKEYTTQQNNEPLLYSVKLAIASLKDRYGDYEESKNIYKEYYEYVLKQENYKVNNSEDYILSLYNLSNGYLRLKKSDSANIYIKEGIFQSLKNKDSISYYEFLTSYGVSNYFKKNYETAIDTLEKAATSRKGYGLAMCYYYKAQCLNELGRNVKSLIYFKKSDSIYDKTKDVFPELRQVYEKLIDDAKSKNNIQDQLLYIEKLLKVDSILDSDFEYISKNIIKKYDTKILLDDQKKIIDSLNKKTIASSYIILLLIILAILITVGALYFIKKREKLYKKRFDELIKGNRSKINENTLVSLKLEKKDNKKSNQIADDVTNIILHKLQRFEKEQRYLEQGITLSKVADSLKTNSSYLSKVVNIHMQKTFNTYINDLRITYVVEKLKVDINFRRYTVKSIAEEIGYANSQSFANAFYKKTGIKPSYYIKQLNIV